MLTDTEFECEKGHVNTALSNHIFLNIDQSKVNKEGDYDTELENMIHNQFSKKKVK